MDGEPGARAFIDYLREFRFGPMAMENHQKVYSEGWQHWINILGDHSKLQLLFNCSVVSNSLPPLDCSMPGFLVFLYLLEFAQTPVHWVDDAIQPSHLLSPPSPYALNLSQHQGLFQWVGSKLQYDKEKVNRTFRLQAWTEMVELGDWLAVALWERGDKNDFHPQT